LVPGGKVDSAGDGLNGVDALVRHHHAPIDPDVRSAASGNYFRVIGFMDYGLWCIVYGLRFMVYGVWFIVYGLWFTVHGLWFRV